MQKINTDNERAFAKNIGYLDSSGEEIRLHLYNMAQEIDHLNIYIVQLECALKNLTK